MCNGANQMSSLYLRRENIVLAVALESSTCFSAKAHAYYEMHQTDGKYGICTVFST